MSVPSEDVGERERGWVPEEEAFVFSIPPKGDLMKREWFNPGHKADRDNRSNQINPNHTPTKGAPQQPPKK